MRRAALALVLVVLALVSGAGAQPVIKVARVGVLSVGAPISLADLAKVPLWAHLKDLGWTLGQNLQFEPRYAVGEPDKLPALAAELVKANVDAILALSNDEALAAKKATSTIPVVMLSGFAPVESGLVASLGHPGGNVTGIGVTPATFGTYVELLKEARPGLQRVAILRDASFASQPTWEEAAKKFGVAATVVDVPRAGDLDTAFETITKEGAEAIIVMPAGPLVVRIQDIAGFGFQNKLPTMVTSRALAEIGGFMSYGSPRDALYKRAAWYVDKVLRDGKPADLPVEEISPLELVVNVKVAKILGMTVPPTLLQRANHVIE